MRKYPYHVSSKTCEILRQYVPDRFLLKNGNQILVEESLFEELQRWKKENTDVSKLIKDLRLSGKNRKNLMAELECAGVVSDEWYTQLHGGYYVRSDKLRVATSILASYRIPQSVERVFSLFDVKKRYGAPEKNIEYAMIAGRITSYNGGFRAEEVEEVYKHDKELISLKSVIAQFETQNQVKITSKMYEHVKETIILNQNWGGLYYLGEVLIRKGVDTKDLYFDTDEVLSRMPKIIVEFRGSFTSDWQPFLWSQIPDKTRELISGFCQTEPMKIKGHPKVQRILEAAASIGKEVSDWNEGDLTMLAREGASKEKRNETRRFVDYARTRGVKVRCNAKEIYEFTQRNQGGYYDNAYSIEQYFELSMLVFDSFNPNESTNIKRSLKDEELAQMLLYLAMLCGVTWRRSNIWKIRIHERNDIHRLIMDLRNGCADCGELVSVWTSLESTWGIKHRADKNNGDLEFFVVSDFYSMLGAYLVVAEFHRIQAKRELLLNPQKMTSKSLLQRAIGKENYISLFGNSSFSTTRLTKTILMKVVEITNVKYKGASIRSLGEILAAHLRGHKLDFNNGQHTILHYINSRSEGLTIDEISYELFLAGTIGFYKHFVAQIVLPEYNRMRFLEQNKVIEALDVIPMKLEQNVEKFESMYYLTRQITTLYPKDFSEFAYIVGSRLMAGDGTANERNVICLYSLVEGKRPEQCRGQRYCDGCGEMAQDGLCKYGLYAKQYVYNLLERWRILERINERINAIKGTAKNEEELKGTYDRNSAVIKYLRELINSFVSNEDMPKDMRKAIRLMILEGQENGIAKLHG